MLKVEMINCYLENSLILRDISFQAAKGEFLGIAGPNGSGKTTLLRTISGILPLTKGRVYLEGKDMSKMDKKRIARKIAMVPQNTFINFPFTAMEVVAMGRTPYLHRFERERKEDLKKVKESMLLTRTWHLRDKKVTEISGGELQRVVIAQALAQNTELLFLDEPTSHLDINHELEILSLIARLNREHLLIVILVTHNLNLIARYCQKLILLKEGKIHAQGEVEDILTSENIKSVYHVRALVKKHPLTGSIYTFPLCFNGREETKRRERIHLVCGGGSGSSLMRELWNSGYEVSVGVINVFDADFETATLLNIPLAGEAPFSPITDESYQKNLRMIRDSEAIILAGVPFGEGNLLNLKVAKKALKEGKRVIVVNKTPIQERDYTKGKATQIFEDLKKGGATFANDEREVLSLIEKILSPDSVI
ncbi:MAG: ABC transporter ATP-binding protein [Candidatus Aerophobetes bacterium]|nr:ABC transporter ATP-binding protein [Candidatus Aerophobetes bacterium]